MSLLRKFWSTLRPLYDFRVLLLLVICAGIGLWVDPVATLGLAGYLAYVIGMWGMAMLLAKILMPYVTISHYARAALEQRNRAAALVVLARVVLVIAIAYCFMFWGK